MQHLTNDDIEDVLLAGSGMEEHLATCISCRQRIAEQAALVTRLRQAFNSIDSSPIFRDQLHSRLMQAKHHRTQSRNRRSDHKLWFYQYPLATAAIIIAVVLLRTLGPISPQISIAQQLEAIHQHNLSEEAELHPHTEPAQLAGFFQESLGFTPRLPVPKDDVQLRGCCIQHFQGYPVATYVTQTPSGAISIIVLDERPKSLSIDQTQQVGNQTYWYHTAAECNLTGTRLGEKYYYAIGNMSHVNLQALLAQLRT